MTALNVSELFLDLPFEFLKQQLADDVFAFIQNYPHLNWEQVGPVFGSPLSKMSNNMLLSQLHNFCISLY